MWKGRVIDVEGKIPLRGGVEGGERVRRIGVEGGEGEGEVGGGERRKREEQKEKGCPGLLTGRGGVTILL